MPDFRRRRWIDDIIRRPVYSEKVLVSSSEQSLHDFAVINKPWWARSCSVERQPHVAYRDSSGEITYYNSSRVKGAILLSYDPKTRGTNRKIANDLANTSDNYVIAKFRGYGPNGYLDEDSDVMTGEGYKTKEDAEKVLQSIGNKAMYRVVQMPRSEIDEINDSYEYRMMNKKKRFR